MNEKSMQIGTAPVKRTDAVLRYALQGYTCIPVSAGKIFPSGKRISDYSDDDIFAVELWANSLPRKVLGYKTPDEALGAEMDIIYAA